MDTMNMFKKDEQMNTFTEDEQVILKNVSSRYKWIARDKSGALFVYASMPKKAGCFYSDDDMCYLRLEPFEDIFKKITWEGGPVRFRKDVLDETERKYLKAVLRPFRNRDVRVIKARRGSLAYLIIDFENGDNIAFPDFPAGTMYNGMELYHEYTLGELGINY